MKFSHSPAHQLCALLEWNMPLGAILLPCSAPTGGVRLGHKQWNNSGVLCTWCNNQGTPGLSLRVGHCFPGANPDEPEESQNSSAASLLSITPCCNYLVTQLEFQPPMTWEIPCKSDVFVVLCLATCTAPKPALPPLLLRSQLPSN